MSVLHEYLYGYGNDALRKMIDQLSTRHERQLVWVFARGCCSSELTGLTLASLPNSLVFITKNPEGMVILLYLNFVSCLKISEAVHVRYFIFSFLT